jgi:hypothetical protein
MQMLYNSDSFTVVQFAPGDDDGDASGRGGGFEIVDKFARREIYLHGDMAAQFRAGVESLMRGSPTEDDFDDFLAGFATLAQQPLVLH